MRSPDEIVRAYALLQRAKELNRALDRMSDEAAHIDLPNTHHIDQSEVLKLRGEVAGKIIEALLGARNKLREQFVAADLDPSCADATYPRDPFSGIAAQSHRLQQEVIQR